MSSDAVSFETPVVLAGGGALDRETLDMALGYGGPIVAADGAADRVAELGHRVALAVGDMDSIGDAGRAASDRTLHIAEQDTTDFEKCLDATDAQLYLAVGFTGMRVDHTLAVLSVMLGRRDKQIVLIGEADVAMVVPADRAIRLAVGQDARVSIFPLRPVMGRSEGLVWPIDGLTLAPGAKIGTSNRASAEEVVLQFETDGALLLLERSALASMIDAIRD